MLPKLGLGYDVLRTLNPRIVMMFMSAFGETAFIAIGELWWTRARLRLPTMIGKPAGHAS
ncbi:hypothetical protein [Bradyrhizobium neotropicale]|uniref:hypothetical protein n=1 Tax=Bradyrhizobium neotropicale TaxID=1497615 RepID=UPI003907F7A9